MTVQDAVALSEMEADDLLCLPLKRAAEEEAAAAAEEEAEYDPDSASICERL